MGQLKFKHKLIIITILAAVIFAVLWLYESNRTDPNFFMKKTTKTLDLDEPADISYDYSSGRLFGNKKIPVFSFTPEESTDYTFTVSDIESAESVYLTLCVTDRNMNDYMSADNSDDPAGDLSETVFLTEGSMCYVMAEAVSADDVYNYSGSFSLSVSKAEEVAAPPELTEAEDVTLSIGSDEQASVLFRPVETAFYGFSSLIVSSGNRSGSSEIDSITLADGKELQAAEGIGWLESGNEYYIWISTADIESSSVDIKVSCRKINLITAEGYGKYRIDGDTIIEYTADNDSTVAVYSVSDGDVRSSVYDTRGFPAASDDNSGGLLSGNEKDFALVMQPEKNTKYLIYAGGEFNECSIVITAYTGDGTAIGSYDIEPLQENQEGSEQMYGNDTDNSTDVIQEENDE